MFLSFWVMAMFWMVNINWVSLEMFGEGESRGLRRSVGFG